MILPAAIHAGREHALESGKEARAIEQASAWAASPAEAYAQVKRQLRAPAMDRIRRAVEERADPMLDGWFTPETTRAALAVLAGDR